MKAGVTKRASDRRPPPAPQERFARKNEAEDLKRAFGILDSKSDGKLDSEELEAFFVKLKHRVKKVRGGGHGGGGPGRREGSPVAPRSTGAERREAR